MRGYENLDEYEDDGFIEHDEEEEQMYEEDEGEEEEVQEEVRKPSKEEIDFLNVRQQIKETMRKHMKKENASSTGNSQERKKHNYGSFFGPSQPVIAQRVIQESKSLLENLHLTSRVLNPVIVYISLFVDLIEYAQNAANGSTSRGLGPLCVGPP